LTSVGLLFPGEMGAAVGRSVRGDVLWASDGRSEATRQRAAEFTDVGSVAKLTRSTQVVLSICPPAIAEAVAEEVFAEGFDGVFVEANAISPLRMRRIAEHGPRVVDGSIIAAKGTHLYLAGREADDVAALFVGSDVQAIPLDADVGAASALKMAFGGWNKIGVALAAQAYAIARAYGVADALAGEGVESRGFVRGSGRAWRWAPEMDEVADTTASLGLPDGMGRAAAELFRRWEVHRDQPAELERLLEDLTTEG
jgi:3-hydroxyisobutyrate dehydrogenase-like beta-hydroxyacid dehydrogenase